MNNKIKRLERLIVFIVYTVMLVSLSACQLFVPLIQGFKESGLTATDRAEMLTKEVKNFHYALTESDRMRALAYATPEFVPKFKDVLRAMSRQEKQVSSQVDFTEMSDDGYKSEIEVFFKYYKQTNYIVRERLVKESWVYNYTSGWKINNFQVMEELN
jgi:hypothetical protein